MHKEETNYEVPQIEVIEVETEKGFASSGFGEDMNPGVGGI